MQDDLELITKALNDGGWIAKIKMNDASQLDDLMNEAAYQDYLAEQD